MPTVTIHIDEELCDGCGACIPACEEGALALVDGKARVVNAAACDGAGACLGECPRGALTLVPEAAPAALPSVPAAGHAPHACPGSRPAAWTAPAPVPGAGAPSALRQWPVQLRLLHPRAPFLRGADLLLAADCVPLACHDFHASWVSGRAVAIACPKLDHGLEGDMAKITAMIDEAGVRSLTVLTMEVPCCSGLVTLARRAVAAARRPVPVRAVVVGVHGDVLADGTAPAVPGAPPPLFSIGG